MSASATTDRSSLVSTIMEFFGSNASGPTTSADQPHHVNHRAKTLALAVTDHYLPALASPLPSFAAEILARLVANEDSRLISALETFPIDSSRASSDKVSGSPNSPTSSQYSSLNSAPAFHDLAHAFSVAILEEYQKNWVELFSEYTTDYAKKTSKTERDQLGLKKACLVYGEISFSSFGIAFLNHMSLTPGGVFYDLGSGSGRAIFAAEMLHDFKKLVGIEILEGLYETSLKVLGKFRELRPLSVQKQIEFHRSDFLQFDWSDGDVIFANSTCFDEQLMQGLGEKGKHLKTGAYFITFTKQLKSPYFDVLHSKQYRMSWGVATVHVQRRNQKTAEPDVAAVV